MYLVEEVLNQFGNPDVIVVSVNQKDLLQVFELRDGVVAVPCRLPTFFSHDALWEKDKLLINQISLIYIKRLEPRMCEAVLFVGKSFAYI